MKTILLALLLLSLLLPGCATAPYRAPLSERFKTGDVSFSEFMALNGRGYQPIPDLRSPPVVYPQDMTGGWRPIIPTVPSLYEPGSSLNPIQVKIVPRTTGYAELP